MVQLSITSGHVFRHHWQQNAIKYELRKGDRVELLCGNHFNSYNPAGILTVKRLNVPEVVDRPSKLINWTISSGFCERELTQEIGKKS